MAEPQSLSGQATLESVRRLAEFVRRRCAEEGLDDMATMDLELAFVEAANNVVLHGYSGADGTVSVSLARVEGGVEVTLEDAGKPMPALPQPADTPSLTAESGRGLAIIEACTDGVRYVTNGRSNRLMLFKADPAG